MATKFQTGGTGKTSVSGSNTKFTGFTKPAPQMAPVQKMNLGGVVVSVPTEYSGEPIGRMAAPTGGGGSDATTDTSAEQFAAPVTEQSGFSWTWIIVGVVVLGALFLIFKKK